MMKMSSPNVVVLVLVLVLWEDGKQFWTCSSETVRLVQLLDEAKRHCKASLLECGKVLVAESPCAIFTSFMLACKHEWNEVSAWLNCMSVCPF